MANTTRSRYQDAWEILKNKKRIDLAARQDAHPRLIEAIKKRKKLDLGFKVLLDSEEEVSKLSFESSHSLLTIRLHIRKRSTWL